MRWTRAIDPTSRYDPYSPGLRRRVIPTLGHLPVGLITAGLVDRAIDRWETEYGRSTVNNTVAALVLARHGLRHTALWMADAGADLHILERVPGHQDPAVTARYLHPYVRAMIQAGAAFTAW